MSTRFEQVLAGQEGNYILPFFWQHGEEETVLRDYMRAIAESHIRAVCVESRPHPDFCGPLWWRDMDIILDEARKRDMKVWILDDVHYPTGYANGALEEADSDLCHQYLFYRRLQICGPALCCDIPAVEYAKPAGVSPFYPQPPAPKRVFHDDRLLKVLAFPLEASGALGTAVDLTDRITDGSIRWDVPAGYWEIYIVFLTRDARGRNDYINLIDARSVRVLIDAVYETHYSHYAADFGKTIAGFFSDETPIGNTEGYTVDDKIGRDDLALPWSPEMPEMLEMCWGRDDWLLHLPLLWRESEDPAAHKRFRAAYMDAMTRLVGKCFSDQIGNWCSEHRVEYIGHLMEHCDIDTELGPSAGHFFRGMQGQHMAGIDNVGGQVLPGGKLVLRHPNLIGKEDALSLQYVLGKLGASLASIDPKKRGLCMCENLGAYGWQCGVSMQKYLMNHFLAKGVNVYVPHAFSPAPFPDPDCPPHFYAHGKNPQYRVFGDLMRYTNRICHLIQGGKAGADVALLYFGESSWTGEWQSNMYVAKELTEHQIDFHIIPSDVFEDRTYYGVVLGDRSFQINGVDYQAFVLSGNASIPAAALRFVVSLQEKGIPVFFTDRLPELVICGKGDEAEQRLLSEALEGQRVCPLGELADRIRDVILPGISVQGKWEDLSVYHYSGDRETWLLMNENPWQAFEGEVTLRGASHVVRYDAWNNVCHPVRQEADTVHVHIEPLELAVLVEAGESVLLCGEEVSDAGWSREVPGRVWISKCLGEEYPHFDDEIAYEKLPIVSALFPDFSGYIRYRFPLSVKEGEQVRLDLDSVYDTAEFFVNGISAGTFASKPYQMDITDLLREGENSIQIEVATTMERRVHAMGKDISSLHLPAPLSASGIVGEIHIRRLAR